MNDPAFPPPSPHRPATPTPTPTPLPDTTPRTTVDRLVDVADRLPRLSPAGWLAATGASLLMVASIVVVAGNWTAIDPVLRFSGLVAALLAVYFVAEAGRRKFPSTAAALAALAGCLTAPVGIAAAATLGEPWPVCTLAGGIAALLATHVQSRRWDLGVLRAATVVAFGLAAVGFAALTGAPAPLVLSIGAVGAALLGSRLRTLALACSVGAAPFAIVVSESGVGPGTLARIGVTGDVLIWSGPVSCALAAFATGIVANRLRNAPLAAASVALLGIGATTSLLSAESGTPTWLAVFAVTLLAAEAVSAREDRSVWRSLARSTTIPLATIAVMLALPASVVAIIVRWGTSPQDVASVQWCVPFGLLGLALAASSVGSARRVGGDWVTLAPLGAAGAAITALACTPAPLVWVALGSAVVWLVVSTVTPWSAWDATTACAACWVALAALVDDQMAPIWFGAVLVAGVATVASCAIVGRVDEGFRAVGAAFVTAVVAAIVAHRFGLPAGHVGPLVAIGCLTVAVAIRPERSLWPLIVGGGVALRGIEGREWFDVALAGSFAVSLAASTRTPTSARAHLAGACAVVAGAFALAAGGVDPGTATVAAAMTGIALSGLATLDRRLAVGRSAGLVAALVAVAASSEASPVFVSMAVIVLGAQVAAFGITTGRPLSTDIGITTSAVATCTLWWTTGTNDRVITAIQPYGADGSDVALAAVTVALMTAGWLLRRSAGTSTWLADAPGLGLAGTWLVASQLEPGTDWATFAALFVGVGSIAVGGLRRLGAPLVFGTATTTATLIVSAGPRLATAPTWAWIAAGGTLLLALAAMIERMDRPVLPIGRRDGEPVSLLEQFCDEFQ